MDPVDVQAIREHCVFPERGRIVTSNAPSTQPPRELPAVRFPRGGA
jgi:cysteine desulfurase / selenocysteine lyase